MVTEPQSNIAQEQIEASELPSPNEQLAATTGGSISTEQLSSELNNVPEPEAPQLLEVAGQSANLPTDHSSIEEPQVTVAAQASNELTSPVEQGIPRIDESRERLEGMADTILSVPLPVTIPEISVTGESTQQQQVTTSTTLRAQAWHHTLATDILDKQYRLYSWNDSKSLSLITTNSVLLAAIGFLFKECLPDAFALLMIMTALVLVALSLYFSLKQVIPQGSSGKSGAEPNVRALRSITQFKNWESYYTTLLEIDEDESFRCAARQIYGMSLNNDISRKTTTKGVRLTLFGILFILLSTLGVALSARDFHALGTWVKPVPQVSQPIDRTTGIAVPVEQLPSVSGGQVNTAPVPSPTPASAAELSPTPAAPSPVRKHRK